MPSVALIRTVLTVKNSGPSPSCMVEDDGRLDLIRMIAGDEEQKQQLPHHGELIGDEQAAEMFAAPSRLAGADEPAARPNASETPASATAAQP